MDLPRSLNAAAAASALAAFVRARLADLGETVGDTLGPFRDVVGARDGRVPRTSRTPPGRSRW